MVLSCTGADVMCIDPAVAKRLGLSQVGKDTAAGVVAVAEYPILQGKSFHLGPVTFDRPTFYGLDLTQISKIFGFPIVGICGYDFLARASVDIDIKSESARICKPGVSLPKVPYTKIEFNSNTPCLQCTFEGGQRGWFNIDTGSNGVVDFCAPAVLKYHLLETRKARASRTGGAGGSAESKVGTLQWFDIGGTRLENLAVGFQSTKEGVYASPYLDGNIGMGMLAHFRLVLDYPNQRIGFVRL